MYIACLPLTKRSGCRWDIKGGYTIIPEMGQYCNCNENISCLWEWDTFIITLCGGQILKIVLV